MDTLYKDTLIEISDKGITFRRYYPFFGSRTVNYDKIARIEIGSPSVADGSWRVWGTGDFQTWFPLDYKRASRDKIFTVFLRNAWRRIGFTVEDSVRVEGILKERGLLSDA